MTAAPCYRQNGMGKLPDQWNVFVGILDDADGIIFGVQNQHRSDDALHYTHRVAGLQVRALAGVACQSMNMLVKTLQVVCLCALLITGLGGKLVGVGRNKGASELAGHHAVVGGARAKKRHFYVVARAVGHGSLNGSVVAFLSQIGVIKQDYIGRRAELQKLEVQINLLRADNFYL